MVKIFGLLGVVAVYSVGSGSVAAVPVINEVLANEPSSSTTLEWIELFNPSAEAVSLDGLYLSTGGQRMDLPPADTIRDSGYYVICRKLFSADDEPSFESVWGNSSGTWGDAVTEDGYPQPFEAAFSLTNASGVVELFDVNDSLLSRFEWTESGSDGLSWERVRCDGAEIRQAADRFGCTPGFLNSVTPLMRDLAIDSVHVSSNAGVTRIEITVIGRCLEPVSYASLFFTGRGPTAAAENDTVAFVTLPEIGPGEAYTLATDFNIEKEYAPMSALLSGDDRARNDTLHFMAPGREFPSLILSEIMLNPEEETGGEWIELYNRSDGPCELSGWQLGDGSDLYDLSIGSLIVTPGSYFVVTEDSAAFAAAHPSLPYLTLQASGWAAFRSSCDTIRLIDLYGLEADRFAYYTAFDDAYTWSRLYDYGYGGQWGRSQDIDGTPGRENQVLLVPSDDRVDVAIERPHFTPDGDGFDDNLLIGLTAPSNDSYTLRFYDRQGRIVRTLFENATFIPEEASWDGRSDGGHRLPIGLYIVYFEAASAGSVKKAVVIAR